jgi:hypothetical protein
MVLFEYRASIILYNFLKSLNTTNVFLIPANVCPIVLVTYIKAKIKYELVDIDDKTLCLDESVVINRIKRHPKKYSGVHFVHTFGLEDSFERFFKEIKDINCKLIVIDDKCLTVPDFVEPKTTYADLILFSTGYSKYVDIGWGGYGFVKESGIIYKRNILRYNKYDLERLTKELNLCLKNKSRFKYKDSNWLGDTSFTYDFNEYKKCVNSELIKITKRKEIINSIYKRMLPKNIQMGDKYSIWRFNILIKNKTILLEKIFSAGYFASSHYAPLANIFSSSKAPIARKLHGNVVNLFNDFRCDDKMALAICEIITKHIK